jgi:hypothetical protein
VQRTAPGVGDARELGDQPLDDGGEARASASAPSLILVLSDLHPKAPNPHDREHRTSATLQALPQGQRLSMGAGQPPLRSCAADLHRRTRSTLR